MKQYHGGYDGFDWDDGNILKNVIAHGITNAECEQVFSNKPFFIVDDPKHSDSESRQIIFGKTDTGKPLFVVYTVRENKVRIISARVMSKKERERFNEFVTTDTPF